LFYPWHFLITEPIKPRYSPELLERLFDLTQGHPALLQLQCRESMNIANADCRKDMTMADLERALQEAIGRETPATVVFWKQFCATTAIRRTVEQILDGQPPTDNEQRLRLEEHGFIFQDVAGQWRLRVPLFADWLRKDCTLDCVNAHSSG